MKRIERKSISYPPNKFIIEKSKKESTPLLSTILLKLKAVVRVEISIAQTCLAWWLVFLANRLARRGQLVRSLLEENKFLSFSFFHNLPFLKLHFTVQDKYDVEDVRSNWLTIQHIKERLKARNFLPLMEWNDVIVFT